MTFEKSDYLPSGNRNCHLALIPDGARRWANREGVTLQRSYSRSVEKLVGIIPKFLDAGVEEVSVFCSVIQNRDRPEKEVQEFITAGLALDELLAKIANDKGYEYRFIGLTAERGAEGKILEPRTGTKTINVVFDYDPFEEIKSALEQMENLTHDHLENFFGNLLINRPIDFVIRTGGYKTLSNFFPLLIGYSRMEFLESLFNDANDSDLLDAFDGFFELPRKYGV